MEIKHDTYRSTPLVNQDDDMMRIVITLPRYDGKKLLKKLETIDKIPNRKKAHELLAEAQSRDSNTTVGELLDSLGFPKE